MATPKSQRIGIWVIAGFMMLGTLGSVAAMVLSYHNQQTDSVTQQKSQADAQKLVDEYSAKQDAQTKQLSDKYYASFSKYASQVASFKSEGVSSVVKTDMVIGTGDTIKSATEYSAYYIGWNPQGVIFDQSIKSGALLQPIDVTSGSVITGWSEGVVGMKVGGVREITIPSAKAYGSTGKGDNIPPNTPIRFIIMIIPKVTPIPVPAALIKYYSSQVQS